MDMGDVDRYQVLRMVEILSHVDIISIPIALFINLYIKAHLPVPEELYCFQGIDVPKEYIESLKLALTREK